MIRKKEDLRYDEIQNLQNGEGTVGFLHLLEKEELRGAGRTYALATLKPGDSIGLHHHKGEQETYYVLEGQGLYNDDGVEHLIGPGDIAHCPDGSSHCMKNVGTTDLRFIALITFTVD